MSLEEMRARRTDGTKIEHLTDCLQTCMNFGTNVLFHALNAVIIYVLIAHFITDIAVPGLRLFDGQSTVTEHNARPESFICIFVVVMNALAKLVVVNNPAFVSMPTTFPIFF